MRFDLPALARTRRGDLPLRLERASSFSARLVGLMFHPPLRPDAAGTPGLLLTGCRWVHGSFLRAPIEVVFLCDRGRVVQISRLDPFSFARGRAGWHGRPCHALELPLGSAARLGLLEGDWILPREATRAQARSVQQWASA